MTCPFKFVFKNTPMHPFRYVYIILSMIAGTVTIVVGHAASYELEESKRPYLWFLAIPVVFCYVTCFICYGYGDWYPEWEWVKKLSSWLRSTYNHIHNHWCTCLYEDVESEGKSIAGHRSKIAVVVLPLPSSQSPPKPSSQPPLAYKIVCAEPDGLPHSPVQKSAARYLCFKSKHSRPSKPSGTKEMDQEPIKWIDADGIPRSDIEFGTEVHCEDTFPLLKHSVPPNNDGSSGAENYLVQEIPKDSSSLLSTRASSSFPSFGAVGELLNCHGYRQSLADADQNDEGFEAASRMKGAAGRLLQKLAPGSVPFRGASQTFKGLLEGKRADPPILNGKSSSKHPAQSRNAGDLLFQESSGYEFMVNDHYVSYESSIDYPVEVGMDCAVDFCDAGGEGDFCCNN